MSDKKEKLIELGIHRRKLSKLVGELLAKADELDYASKLWKKPASSEWRDRFASTCAELASLNQAVEEVDALVKAGKVKPSEDVILRCANIANHLSHRLNELKHEASVLG